MNFAENPSKNSRFEEEKLLNLFDTGSFIWGITFHNLKYLDKPIKCLEMRANIKSVRKINEILPSSAKPKLEALAFYRFVQIFYIMEGNAPNKRTCIK